MIQTIHISALTIAVEKAIMLIEQYKFALSIQKQPRMMLHKIILITSRNRENSFLEADVIEILRLVSKVGVFKCS